MFDELGLFADIATIAGFCLTILIFFIALKINKDRNKEQSKKDIENIVTDIDKRLAEQSQNIQRMLNQTIKILKPDEDKPILLRISKECTTSYGIDDSRKSKRIKRRIRSFFKRDKKTK